MSKAVVSMGKAVGRIDPTNDRSDDLSTLLTVMQKILAGQDEIRDMLARVVSQRIPDSDADTMAKLLPGIAGRHGSDPFTAGEVLEDPALRKISGRKARSLGKLLSRCSGRSFDGLMVQAVGVEHNSVLWQITKVLD
jgi:hypothetical protein